jgi:uncharacterized membrane protein
VCRELLRVNQDVKIAGLSLVAVGYTGRNLRFRRSKFFLEGFDVNNKNPKKFFKKIHFWRFAVKKTDR